MDSYDMIRLHDGKSKFDFATEIGFLTQSVKNFIQTLKKAGLEIGLAGKKKWIVNRLQCILSIQ